MRHPTSPLEGASRLQAGWQARTAAAVVLELGSDPRQGLHAAAAAARLAVDGPNSLRQVKSPRPLRILVRQLKSPLVYVLLAAALLSLGLGHLTDAGFICFVLLVNSVLGAWQEWNAERQSRALQGLLRIRATVVRDGVARDVDAAELVRGDIVSLESGQYVPADLRLLDSRGLEINEALLTGESLPVAKDANVLAGEHALPAECPNCAFAATLVLRGRAQGIVVATGAATEVGRLAQSMSAVHAGKPPLTERMERFSRTIAVVVLLAAVLIATIAVLIHHHSPFTMFTFGVALAVSAIPEGLPVAVTVALAIAARRMAARGAIVRQLPAVEGLGSCSLIASDKTGTLTCNELTVRMLHTPDGSSWRVTGGGYRPTGAIEFQGIASPTDPARALLLEALRVAAACNEAELVVHEGSWVARGDPTDLALLAFAGKGGLDREALLLERPCTQRIAYEPELRFAATYHAHAGRVWVAVKGAPERVLAMCGLDAWKQRAELDGAEALARGGMRVLALASAYVDAPADPATPPPEPSGLEFRGLVGLIDPLRDGAAAAVQRCAEAGIRVVMITGDHPLTALAIARELGIATDESQVVHGAQLERASPEDLRAAIGRARVFARATPEQKLELVAAAQAAGHFVAVTGDGVNDAPALRRANIGIAMGRGGTDVARQASDLVLSDDNFATIVAGVEEGRIAYQNIRNVVYLLTAAGTAEVLTVGVAVLAGLPLPLLPVQLLWLNLVTNGIQDVGLAFERGRGDELRHPPRPSRERIFDPLMLQRGLLAGLWMSALGLGLFVLLLDAGLPIEHVRNSLLLLMVLMQNIDAINARSETVSVLRLPPGHNPLLMVGVSLALGLHVVAMYTPWLQGIISVQPPAAGEWITLPLLAATLLVVMEVQKLLRRRYFRTPVPAARA
ncbi:MAG TPA: HAD-IC family P-type ATPase [Steroidobacteraceae bacterium]